MAVGAIMAVSSVALGTGVFILRSLAVDMMARTMWGEARSEGERGMRGVGHVIQNRARDKRGIYGGNTIPAVISKEWAFEIWSVDSANTQSALNVTEADPSFALAKQIAADIFDGNSFDPTDGATLFHDTSIGLPWDPNKVTATWTYGRLRFYRE